MSKVVQFHLRIHEISTMPAYLYRQCERLNWRDKATMLGKLQECRAELGKGFAVLAMQGRRVAGWSMVTPKPRWRLCTMSFYVDKEFRRMKLGQWLVRAASSLASVMGLRVGFFGHENARDFFARCRKVGALPEDAENVCITEDI